MSGALILRRMRAGEEGRLWEVLRAAVHKGPTRAYDDAQRRAWAPPRPDLHWADRLRAAECFVAVSDDTIVGFMSVTRSGHLDYAYVLPECQGAGVGSQLLERIEREMRLGEVTRLTAGASLTALAFFERRGWTAGRQETVERAGQALPRVQITRDLPAEED